MSSTSTILDENLYGTRPEMFESNIEGDDLETVFSDEKVREAAARIIRQSQRSGLWKPFVLEKFPDSLRPGLDMLISRGLLKVGNGLVKISSEFVDRCCTGACDGDD